VARPGQERTVFDNANQVKLETQRILGIKVYGKELADKESVAYKSNFC
jgi:hypothetical protein